MAELHEHDIIHRDFKSENVFVDLRLPDDFKVVVGDLGLASCSAEHSGVETE
jgi:serine/threonine protein kinase